MAVVRGQPKAEFHPTLRRKVLASADVDISQVQVVDKNGQVRPIVVWRCGSDIVYSQTMDGLFDTDRRHSAPKWLIEQLDVLEPSRRFDSKGVKYSEKSGDDEVVEAPEPLRLKTSDGDPPEGFEDDLPGISQA